jgi:hypothetical protein
MRRLYEYDAVGSRTAVIHPNGTRAAIPYDALNRLTHLENLRADLSVIPLHLHCGSGPGNRQDVIESSGRVVVILTMHCTV